MYRKFISALLFSVIIALPSGEGSSATAISSSSASNGSSAESIAAASAKDNSNALAVGVAEANNGSHAAGAGIAKAENGSDALGVGVGIANNGSEAAGVGVGVADNGSQAAGVGVGAANNGSRAAGVGVGAADNGSQAAGVGVGVADNGSQALGVGIGAADNNSQALGVGIASADRGSSAVAAGIAVAQDHSDALSIATANASHGSEAVAASLAEASNSSSSTSVSQAEASGHGSQPIYVDPNYEVPSYINEKVTSYNSPAIQSYNFVYKFYNHYPKAHYYEVSDEYCTPVEHYEYNLDLNTKFTNCAVHCEHKTCYTVVPKDQCEDKIIQYNDQDYKFFGYIVKNTDVLKIHGGAPVLQIDLLFRCECGDVLTFAVLIEKKEENPCPFFGKLKDIFEHNKEYVKDSWFTKEIDFSLLWKEVSFKKYWSFKESASYHGKKMHYCAADKTVAISSNDYDHINGFISKY